MSKVKRISQPTTQLQSLSDAQSDLASVWKKVDTSTVMGDQRVVFIQSDTGTGKDEGTLSMAKKRDVFALQPHDRLSKEMHQRAKQAGLQSMHIRSRTAGASKLENKSADERLALYHADDSIQCLHPERCQALISRVGSCREVLCNEYDCEVYGMCKRYRYLSQFSKSAQCNYVNYSWQTLLTDPGAVGTVAKLLTERKKQQTQQPFFVVGEVGATELLNTHYVSIDEIAHGIQSWHNEPLGEFYLFLEMICKLSLTPIERAIQLQDLLKHVDMDMANKQLSKIVIDNDHLSLSNAVATGRYEIDTVPHIHELPRLYQQGWTLIDRLEHMFLYAAQPVIFFDGQVLEFSTLPQLTKMVDTIVMQSATADATQIQSLMESTRPDIYFTRTPYQRVKHHTQARIYKVRTGRYVRQTVFEYDKDWNIIGLREQGRKHLERIVQLLKDTPGRKHLNTYKPIYDGDELADDPLIKDLRVLKDITFSNWKSSYGLNLTGVTLIEFGTNEPSTEMLKSECEKVYQFNADSLDFSYRKMYWTDTHEYANARTYYDDRVQAQYDQMTSMAQYQVINRNRPVRNACVTVVYSNHPCPLIDDRVVWVEPKQLQGNLLELEILNTDDRIVELYKEGMNNTQIGKEVGMHRVSVARHLKELGLTQ